MTAEASADDAVFCDPLPAGFAARTYRTPPGRDLVLDPAPPTDAIVILVQGELELQCRAGARRRFERGSMIPIARLPAARLRSVGSRPLVLVAVARTSDEFRCAGGSHDD